MPETKQRTVKDWLEELVKSNTSSAADDAQMAATLRKAGFNKVVCTCGIVYLEGHGTMDAPPMPIQSIAKMILDKAGAKNGRTN